MCTLCQKDGLTERHKGRQPKPKPEFRPRKRGEGASLAWAAGFFDGEGWTSHSISRAGRHYVQVGISQKDTRNLVRFAEAVGAGSVTHPRRISVWRANGADAYRVMERLWPYLGEAKKDQFLRAEAAAT